MLDYGHDDETLGRVLLSHPGESVAVMVAGVVAGGTNFMGFLSTDPFIKAVIGSLIVLFVRKLSELALKKVLRESKTPSPPVLTPGGLNVIRCERCDRLRVLNDEDTQRRPALTPEKKE